ARLMSAVIVLLELVVGVALGEQLAKALVTVHNVQPIPLPEWTKWPALACASIGVAIIVQARPKQIGWIFTGCIVGYLGSYLGTMWLRPPFRVLLGAPCARVVAGLYSPPPHPPAPGPPSPAPPP